MKEINFKIYNRDQQVNMQNVVEGIAAVESKVTAGSGPPSGGNSGDVYVDLTNSRIYANISGTWKYATLT